MQSLCLHCRHKREIVSGKGSRFLMCRLSQSDRRFVKYPPQPVVRCEGYAAEESGEGK
jgi:hypothetical protein